MAPSETNNALKNSGLDLEDVNPGGGPSTNAMMNVQEGDYNNILPDNQVDLTTNMFNNRPGLSTNSMMNSDGLSPPAML